MIILVVVRSVVERSVTAVGSVHSAAVPHSQTSPHKSAADALNDELGLAAKNDVRLLLLITRTQNKILTSASPLCLFVLSSFKTSISFVNLSISALCISSLNLAASNAPRNEASCVWADNAGVFPLPLPG